MSRVAKNPVILPQGVEVKISVGEVTVIGPLGSISFISNPAVLVSQENDCLLFRPVECVSNSNALSGTVRAIISNMVIGVSKGFERKLNLVGVGYRAQAQGDVLNLTLGFSHPVTHKMPYGVRCETPSQTEILIKGIDKQLVGQVAAEVRAYREPEPYKGKGVRYSDEVILLKETKKK
jgi:large subunit ribosomal protein L6